MLNLEEMADRRITGANYITSVNGLWMCTIFYIF